MSVQLRVRIIFALSGVVLAACTGGLRAQPAQAGESEKLLAEVKAAWEKRQAATKTIRMAWSGKTFTPKGARNLILPAGMVKDGKPRPPADATHDSKAILLLDDLKARYAEEEVLWSEPDFAFRPTRVDTGFIDGKSTALRYHGTQKWPDGIISKSEWNAYCVGLPTWAPCIAVRGQSSEVMNGDGLSTFTLARRTVIEGKQLIEMIRPRNEYRGEIKMWVDAKQDYSAIRYETYHHKTGEVRQRVVATVQQHSSGVWLPTRWVSSHFREKTLVGSTTSTMTTVEVGLGVTEDAFRIAFPTGTEVEDRSGEKRVNYILKDDGSQRVILPSEATASYEDLIKTETGALAPQKPASWIARNWWIWIATGIVLVLLALLLYRKARSSTSVPPTS